MTSTLKQLNVQIRDIQPGGTPTMTIKWRLNTDTDENMHKEGSFGMAVPPGSTTLAQLRTLIRNELTTRGII